MHIQNALKSLKTRIGRPGPAFKRIAIAVTVLLMVWVVLLRFVLPGKIIQIAQQQTQAQIGRRLMIESLSIHPFTLKTQIKGIHLFEANGMSTAVDIDELIVNVSTASLVSLAPVLDEVSLIGPKIKLVRTGPKTLNYTDVIEKILAMPPSKGEPARFSINNIRIASGRIVFQDQPAASVTELSDIELGIPFISNFPSKVKINVTPSFSAKLNGSPLALNGTTRPFEDSHESNLRLKLDGFDLTAVNEYIPDSVPFTLKSGRLHTDMQVQFRQPKGKDNQLLIGGRLSVEQLDLRGSDASELLAWKDLSVQLGKVEPLLQSVQLESVALTEPQVRLDRAANGQLAIMQALTKAQGKAPSDTSVASAKNSTTQGAATEPPAPSKPWALEVGTVLLEKGAVQWTDASTGAPAFATRVSPIDLKISDLRTQPKEGASPAKVTLSLEGDAFEKLSIQSEFSLAPVQANGELQIQKLLLKKAMPYAKPYLNGAVEDGSLSASLPFEFKDGVAHLNNASAALEKFAVRYQDPSSTSTNNAKASPTAAVALLKLGEVQMTSEPVRLDLGQVQIKGASIDAVRTVDGINLARLARSETDSSKAGKAVTSAPSDPVKATSKVPTAAATAANAPVVTVGTLKVEQSKVSWTDEAAAEPVKLTLNDIGLTLSQFNSKGDTPFKLDSSVRVEKAGLLKTAGQVQLAPLNAQLALTLQNVPFNFVQGYAADALNIRILDGKASGKLNALLKTPAPKKGTTASAESLAPSVGLKGSLTINDFQSIDKAQEADFVRFKTLGLNGLDVAAPDQGPLSVNLESIDLGDFYARVIVNNQGRMNLQDIAVQKQPEQPSASGATAVAPNASASQAAPVAAESPAPMIRIGQIRLNGGNVNFTDNFIKPNYSANLKDLKGTVSTLSSALKDPADVNITGSVDGDGILDVKGKLNPLVKPMHLDIAAKATDIELTKLSPYSAKYAGYAIEKGKLSTQVKYHIENNQLSADNQLFIDQLTFGEKIEGPDATKLPVLLAVSLLKNSRGEIDLNLPVSGSLNDPQFSIGGIILKVIVNVLTKAVIAPFSLLANAFGGANAEEMAYIEFAPGTHALTPASLGKINQIVKVLADKGGVKMDVIGRVDPAQDVDGLKRSRLLDKMKVAKLKELSKNSEGANLATVTIEPAERTTWLEKVYSNEKFDKPKNLIGLSKKLPAEDMEKLILQNTVISQDDLRQLALQRAGEVRNAIEATGKVSGDRLFLVSPKLTAEGIQDKGKTTRVDFALK